MKTVYDLAGIGIGPANLGLAALLQPAKSIKSIFFDKKKSFQWYSSIYPKNSDLQVHYLKDLVTLVDPTSPYSFLSYLSKNKRLYQFLHQDTNVVSRKEYEKYYQWVSSLLNNLLFSSDVKNVTYQNGLFNISLRSKNKIFYAKHLSIGVGKKAYVPSSAEKYLSSNVLHSIDFVPNQDLYNDKQVCVVGGGQSAAEIVYELISSESPPKRIYWINKKYSYAPLEDSCFSNEYYSPSYCRHFYNKKDTAKAHILKVQHVTNNGISQSLLNNIYRKIYELKFIEDSDCNLVMLPSHVFEDIEKITSFYEIKLYNELDEKSLLIKADYIIFATGFKNEIPELLSNIRSTLNLTDKNKYYVNTDFSLSLNKNISNKIYIQNGAADWFGLGDTNLGIFAWRNAVIINSIIGQDFYNTNSCTSLLLPELEDHDLFNKKDNSVSYPSPNRQILNFEKSIARI